MIAVLAASGRRRSDMFHTVPLPEEPLSVWGQRDAEVLGQDVRERYGTVSWICASNSASAIATAVLVGGMVSYSGEIGYVEELDPRYLGRWDEDVGAILPRNELQLTEGGAETMTEVIYRVAGAISSVLVSNHGETALVIVDPSLLPSLGSLMTCPGVSGLENDRPYGQIVAEIRRHDIPLPPAWPSGPMPIQLP